MTMTANGLAKLTEECGELSQVASKKMACMDSDVHWDGAGSLARRLEDEIADVRAASALVEETFGLDKDRIASRAAFKLSMFRQWHGQTNNAPKEPK